LVEQRSEAEPVPGLDGIETGAPRDWLCERPEDIARAAQAIADLPGAQRVNLVQLNGAALGGQVRFVPPLVTMHHSCLATWRSAVKDGLLPADWTWRHELTRNHPNAVDGGRRWLVPRSSRC